MPDLDDDTQGARPLEFGPGLWLVTGYGADSPEKSRMVDTMSNLEKASDGVSEKAGVV
jgi:hypothetical protein